MASAAGEDDVGAWGPSAGGPAADAPCMTVPSPDSGRLEPGLRVRHDLRMAPAAAHAEPIEVALDGAALADLTRRLRAARMPAGTAGTWERGTPAGWLADLVADWQAFDPVALQARLDQLTHLSDQVNGMAVHVVHGTRGHLLQRGITSVAFLPGTRRQPSQFGGPGFGVAGLRRRRIRNPGSLLSCW